MAKKYVYNYTVLDDHYPVPAITLLVRKPRNTSMSLEGIFISSKDLSKDSNLQGANPICERSVSSLKEFEKEYRGKFHPAQ